MLLDTFFGLTKGMTTKGAAKAAPYLNKLKKQRDNTMRGKLDEEASERMILGEVFDELVKLEYRSFAWKHSFEEAVRLKKDRDESYTEEYYRSSYPNTLFSIDAKLFSQDVALNLQQTLAQTIIYSRPELFLVDCYLQSKTGAHGYVQRMDFVRNKLAGSPYFDEEWENAAKRYYAEPNIYEAPLFKPEREDVVKYFEMLHQIHEVWIDMYGVIPVNEYGEFVDGGNNAMPMGRIVFTKGIEHGMPDLDMTAERYPHMNFYGMYEEKPVMNARKLFASYNYSNDSSDPYVRKALGLDLFAGRTDVVIMPDYLAAKGR